MADALTAAAMPADAAATVEAVAATVLTVPLLTWLCVSASSTSVVGGIPSLAVAGYHTS